VILDRMLEAATHCMQSDVFYYVVKLTSAWNLSIIQAVI
jgi:hypothetical protein